jgi:phosphatidylglycerophosphatase A
MKNKKLAYAIATFFGVGYFPKAPGTAGSLAALPFAFLLTYCGGFFAILAFFAVVYIAGTVASKEVLKYTSHDPSFIVIDEVAGQLVPFVFYSWFTDGVGLPTTGDWWLAAFIFFILFRIFDILKPFPANYLDKKVLNAHGVMLDDIVAGIYVILVLLIFLSLFHVYIP